VTAVGCAAVAKTLSYAVEDISCLLLRGNTQLKKETKCASLGTDQLLPWQTRMAGAAVVVVMILGIKYKPSDQ
jgi:hypothetical protein